MVIAQALGDHADATEARAERIDGDGIDLALATPRGPATVRVDFDRTVIDYPDGLRVAFVRLARAAIDVQARRNLDTPN